MFGSFRYSASLVVVSCVTTLLILPEQLRGKASNDKTTSQPNIILILVDDLGYSDLGCFGGEIETPNIDALANHSARFTQFYNSARCCPTRAALMTGLYPSQAGIGSFTYDANNPQKNAQRRTPRSRGDLGYLVDECVTLGEVLGDAGYQTFAVGKWHLNPFTGPLRRGFDQFYGYTRGHSTGQWNPQNYQRLPVSQKPELDYSEKTFYATDVFSDYALEFIDQAHQKTQPYFLYLAHSSPHFPLHAPKGTIDHYFERYRAGWDQLRQKRFERQKKIGLATESWQLTERSLVPVDPVAESYSGKPNPAWDSLDQARQSDLARRMAIFAAMVHHVDIGVGRIVADLKSRGTFDNTLILFTSDNGACYEWSPIGFDGRSRRKIHVLHEGDQLAQMGQPDSYHAVGSAWSNLSNTPFRLYKHFTHEGGICSPLLAHWPAGIGTDGKWIRTPGHVIDIMATVCQAAQTEYPTEFRENAILPTEGQSLLSACRGNTPPPRGFGIEHQRARAYREGDWKIVLNKRTTLEPQWELYNLANDRCETNDLSQAYPDRLRAMIAKWDAWAKRTMVPIKNNNRR